MKNGGESDVDCGQPCPPGCGVGEVCLVSEDCESLECQGAAVTTCVAPSCFDSHQNGDETGINCGGSCAQKCPSGYGCLVNADCIGNTCNPATQLCDPTCSDGFMNGGETDPDCGGPCPGCGLGGHCITTADCAQGVCYPDGHCLPPP